MSRLTRGSVVGAMLALALVGASGAIMHVPTGLYVHGAYGIRVDDNIPAGFDDESTQWYIQAGIEQKFFPLGKTTIFGEYQRWDIGRNQAFLFDSAEMTMWGVGINQSIEAAAMDLYISYRNYSPEAVNADITSPIGSFSGEFEDFQTIMAGGIIKF